MEPYQIIWFVLIAILYTGYFVLEGFDFGVGILLPFLGKDDQQRRMIINSIGPHWDGNEVWLITAGGATFAAFPNWYATLFSGFYLPLFLILIALILRGVAFEFRSKDANLLWRSFWDWMIFFGSAIPAFLWGVAFTNFIRGVPIDAMMQYTGGFFNLLNPYAVLGGIVFILLFLLQGAGFLALKTQAILADPSKKIAINIWLPSIIGAAIFSVITFWRGDDGGSLGNLPIILGAFSVIMLIISGLFQKKNREANGLIFSSLGILFLIASIFSQLFPRVLVSSTDPMFSLTITNSSSGLVTLQTMTIVAALFVPIVLAYQAWSFWVFKKKISSDPKTLHY